MIIVVLIVGAIAIMAIFAFLAKIIINFWLKIIKHNEEYDKKNIRKIKKKSNQLLAIIFSKDYDIERRDIIVGVTTLFAVLCIAVLYIWFSVGGAFLNVI